MVPIEQVYSQIGQMAQEAGAQRVLLFGSRARGTNHPKSDIDLAVEGCRDCASFKENLRENLWSLLGIDLIDLDSCKSSELREDIARDGVVLYEKV